MKGLAPLFLGLLFMVGCPVGKPATSDIESIEIATQHNACVGSLNRWHREFAFQKRGNRIDRDIVSVTYTQAGHRGLPAGRFVEEPGFRGIIDDTQFRVAGGEYDRNGHRFVEWTCGCNFPPYDVDHPIECPSNGG